MTSDKFRTITGAVIDLLEGGYFHPYMLDDGRVSSRFADIYSKSGETMYGLDRHAGHDLFYTTPRKTSDVRRNLQFLESKIYKYRSQAAQEFWTLIDNSQAARRWQWNYRGGENETRLKQLAADILQPYFIAWLNKYCALPVRNAVENSPALLIHFAYAVWNGEGFFRFYAGKLNDAWAAGVREPGALVTIINNARINSNFVTIRNTGQKIIDFFNSANFDALKKKLVSAAKPLTLILVAAAVAAFFYSKRRRIA